MKNIKLINDRGYVLVAGLEGVPEIAKFVSFEIIPKADNEKDITIKLLADDKGTKIGEMVKKGYFQLGEIFEGGKDSICVSFKDDNKINMRVATKEEVDENSKATMVKKAEKKTSKGKSSDKTSAIDKLLAEGIIKQDGDKAGRFVYVKPHEVTENDKITCLRKSGTFTVKSVDKAKGVVSAEDNNKQHHYFSTKEVALTK